MTHLAIGELEKQSQLPGARTVLTAGPRIDYHMTAVTMDDLVMKYTKVTPDGPSRLPAAIAQLTLALNPAPLQMNLAFSKAYLLDSIGSRQGLSGPHFYLDESVLREARSLAAAEGCTDGIIDECENGVRLFAVRASETRYYFGFELTDGAIHVDDPRLKTTVWRVRSFFPCDEDFDEFKFEFPLVGS